jgi:predicted ATP-dependent serine protease
VGLDAAIARLEQRYGTHAVLRVGEAERRAGERRVTTGTSLDRVTGGALASGAPLAFVGARTSGKLSLALRAAAGAQREGGAVLWVDPSASFDPRAASRAGVDLDRLFVVRARTPDEVARAAGTALRGDGFRLVVADCGASLGRGVAIDDLASTLPLVRGSTAALLVVSERAPRALALPQVAFARVAWERRFERTAGYSVAASRGAERALFHVGALGSRFLDVGANETSQDRLAS